MEIPFNKNSLFILKNDVHEWSDIEINNLIATLSKGIPKKSDKIKFRIK